MVQRLLPLHFHSVLLAAFRGQHLLIAGCGFLNEVPTKRSHSNSWYRLWWAQCWRRRGLFCSLRFVLRWSSYWQLAAWRPNVRFWSLSSRCRRIRVEFPTYFSPYSFGLWSNSKALFNSVSVKWHNISSLLCFFMSFPLSHRFNSPLVTTVFETLSSLLLDKFTEKRTHHIVDCVPFEDPSSLK